MARLEKHLEEQVSYLQSNAAAYDQGHEHFSKLLAVTLRNLLYDSRVSHSLLGQMVDLTVQRFPCVNQEPVGDNVVAATGGMFLIGEGAGAIRTFAKTEVSQRTAPFPEWWWETCVVSSGTRVTRRSAVLALANQGGGAHVDLRTDSDYRQIVEFNSLGWAQVSDEQPIPTPENALNNPLPAIVRATTAEVLT